MSEIINNRQEKLKELILKLHDGENLEAVKAEFKEHFESVSTAEISAMERSLVEEGMAPVEIQRLCDVHASLFEGSIEQIHHTSKPQHTPGHPVYTFRLENIKIKKLIEREILPLLDTDFAREDLFAMIGRLLEIDKHYARKENVVFPYMEKHGITAPPKVMWGVDDEIRNDLKGLLRFSQKWTKEELVTNVIAATKKVLDMISKEENILFPMILDTFSEAEWATIFAQSKEFETSWVVNPPAYLPQLVIEDKEESIIQSGSVLLSAGALTYEETNAIFNTVPFDMTFVGADDKVKFFTQGKERVFSRPLSVIGREVKNCHPPQSVHIVEKIVEDLRSGKKDHEDFWINFKGMFVHIRYYAVRNEKGEYLGTLEVTQDIAPIRALDGEKRLMDE
ncbi:MAG: PAS domain S-box protein [Firmicutes bacterium HGW-Firmicutes-20]|jgi:uncharacterized protein|nr:MAG: PAS domain S-box protein [Firmicutes bacterium HGW-Firmicutes-20]